MNRRAVRLAAFSLLLPVPVAMAVPQSATVPNERLVAMSSVPLSGVGDTVLPRVMPVKAAKADKKGPSASLTKVSKREQAQAFRASEVAANGVPQAALRAYRTAEATMAIADPSCELSWALLAGIGRVESDHGRFANATLGRDGVSTPKILGLPLDGAGPVSAIADTDGGSLDGDKVWDRAVGPMQFIPSTWAMVGVDGDGDDKRNPHDLDDAALAAAAYLCVGGNDLSTTAGMQKAVYSYNHSAEYVTLVLKLAEAYKKGLVDLPALAASPMSGLATGPGVDVGLDEGRGVPIGGSDDTSTKEHGKSGNADAKADRKGDDKAADKADRKTKEHGRSGNAGDKTWPNRPHNNQGNDNQGNERPNGGSNSTPPRDRSDGGNGTGNRDENGDTGGGKGKKDNKKAPGWVNEPKKRTPNNDRGDGGQTGREGRQDDSQQDRDQQDNSGPSESDKGEQANETEEPRTDLLDEGTLDYCDDSQETVCYISPETGVSYQLDEDPADYENEIKQGSPVRITYDLAADGETWENIALVE